MRGMVLLLLGGGLLWFVLKNFSSSKAAEGPADEPAAGYFLPAEPATEPAPEPELPERQASAPEAAAIRAQEEIPSRQPAPEQVVPPAMSALETSTPGEIGLASDVLHRPTHVARVLTETTHGLSEGRRKLVLGFAAVLAGRESEARELANAIQGDLSAGTSSERALLEATARPAEGRLVSAVSRETPLMTAASMGLLARRGHAALEAGQHREAAQVFSELLVAELQAPWKAEGTLLHEWSDSLKRAQAGYQWNRKGGWPSIEVTVARGDSLIALRKRVLEEHPELLLCTGQIERCNQLNGTPIQPGQVLRVPTDRARVLVDVDAHWVLYFLGDLVAGSWEVGVGKPGSVTQTGTYTVGDKNTDPMWFPPGKPPIPHGDPENPLGTRWIGWVDAEGRNSGLAFHGTRDPESIGQDQSQGCVRMLNRNVEELFEILPKGALISVQP